MRYRFIITGILIGLSNIVFAYNLTVINKARSDIEIGYVICTELREKGRESFICDSKEIKFQISAKSFVKNPFVTSMMPYPTPSLPYSFTFPSLVSVTSLSGDFEKVHLLSYTDYMEAEKQLGNEGVYIKYGASPQYNLRFLSSLDSNVKAIVIDDEDLGFPHIQVIARAGFTIE